MNPEKRFLIILEYLPVKLQIFFSCTLIRVFHPKGSCLVQKLRALYDLNLGFILLLLRFDFLYHRIGVQLFFCIDRLGFCGIFLGKINLCRHEGTIFFNNFSCLIFITEFQHILIQEQRNCSTNLCLIAFLHVKLSAAVTLPVYRLCPFLPGKRINMHFISHHKCRIKSKSEMTNDLVLVRLILILFNKVCGTGKSNLIDIFFYFIRCHTNTVIDKLQRLLFRINQHLNLPLVILGKCILTHHIQFFQLRDRITSVRDQLSEKNVMIRIQPLLDNRKNVFTVNR